MNYANMFINQLFSNYRFYPFRSGSPANGRQEGVPIADNSLALVTAEPQNPAIRHRRAVNPIAEANSILNRIKTAEQLNSEAVITSFDSISGLNFLPEQLEATKREFCLACYEKFKALDGNDSVHFRGIAVTYIPSLLECFKTISKLNDKNQADAILSSFAIYLDDLNYRFQAFLLIREESQAEAWKKLRHTNLDLETIMVYIMVYFVGSDKLPEYMSDVLQAKLVQMCQNGQPTDTIKTAIIDASCTIDRQYPGAKEDD